MFAIDVGDAAAIAPATASAHLALGAALRAYRFDKYRTTERPERKPTLAALTIAGPAAAAARYAYRDLAAVSEAVALTRDLVSEPGNVIYPETLAEQGGEACRRSASKSRCSTKPAWLLSACTRSSALPKAACGRRGSSSCAGTAGPRAPRRSPSSARA